MLEFHRDRFVQLLHEVPAKETILSEPKYSPYLQTVMDTVKKDGVLNLAMINWLAFEMEEVTPEGLNDICRRTESGWIAALAGNSKKRRPSGYCIEPSFEVRPCMTTNMNGIFCFSCGS